jgi:hypothetical protein
MRVGEDWVDEKVLAIIRAAAAAAGEGREP